MKLAFAHDHFFQKDINGNLFTGGSFNNYAWKRYLVHFDELVVLARVENMKDENNNKVYNSFDLNETSLIPVPSLGGVVKQFKNKKNAKEIIRHTLIDSDALIARLPSEIGNLAIEVAKELNKPYAVEVVACVWDALWNHGSIMGKMYAPLATLKMRNHVYTSKYSLYVTEEFLQKRYPSRGFTTEVSNVEIIDVHKNAYKMRKARLKKSTVYKIGLIGSLKNQIKGQHIAFEALSLLKKKGIKFKLYLLGDGDTKPWIKTANDFGIINEVEFCGVLPGGEPVLEWLDQLDLYIQPSFQEGLPRAVIEAMSRGCPVIGSNAGGIPELINENCIHKVGDYKGLSKKIEDIILNEELSLKLTLENIDKSKKYKKLLLDQKRKDFWNDFVMNELKLD